MFNKLKGFWSAFWNALKSAYNTAFKNLPEGKAQDFKDIRHINFLATFVSKLNNLSNIESTFEIESDSSLTEKIKELCKDLENNRFAITETMLGEGDIWIFPAHNGDGELYHRYISRDKVRVTSMDGEKITGIIGIIDEYVDNNKKTYFLNRVHTLKGDVLTIETYTTDEQYKKVSLAQWEEFESVWQIHGADNIGIGRFKSPVSGRGLSPVYGVPLNFGCDEIEARIFHDLEMIETEFNRAESKIFADPLTLRKTRDKDGTEIWNMPEGVFPKDTRGGTSSATIDIFSPAIRYSAYRDKLIDDMLQYEKQVGTDRGFLTPMEESKATTATEIRRANASTIALIDNIHTAQKNGVESTLRADALFLGISPDLYTVKYDFFDVFEDIDKQYERLANAVDRGIAEKKDEIKWLFPSLTDEEINEKIASIEASRQVNTDAALEQMLTGQ